MATDNADAQTNGIANHATGSFTGAGAAVDVICGFTPRVVRVLNLTDRISDEKHEGMAATEVLHTVADGTRTLDTGGHLAFADPVVDGFRGFSMIADVAINAKVIYWEAFG
jgi:hypothetical protein